MALEILVEYAYTAQLDVPDALVKDVYLAASQLRIDSVVNECARHLVEELCADSCIETRSLPGITKNRSFATAVDDFISREVFKFISQSSMAKPRNQIFTTILRNFVFSSMQCPKRLNFFN